MSRIITIRGHHIEDLIEYFRLKIRESKKDPFYKIRIAGYGKKYIENKRKIYEQLYSNPQQRIKIVMTLDDLCKACSIKRHKNCSYLPFSDPWAIKDLGLMCGKIYSTQTLLYYAKK